MRIAVLFDNLGPYHVARLAHAAEHADILAVEVRGDSAVYSWQSPELPHDFERVRLLEGVEARTERWDVLTDTLESKVAAFEPEAIFVPGWATPAAIAATSWGIASQLPMVVMSESNAWDFPRNVLSEFVKSRLLKSFSAALCGGVSHRDYLIDLGLEANAIFFGYNAVDNEYFSRSVEEVKLYRQMPEIEPGKRLDPRWYGRYFLASARFVAKKNLQRLLEAYARLHESLLDRSNVWPLVVLGDGILRPALEAQRRNLNLEGSVFFPGFRQYSELPQFYGTAGAFVHASTTEQWGLVVNEAMASGLTVLVSKYCGCANSLVVDEVNGFTFDPLDVNILARLMHRVQNGTDLRRMGEEGKKVISRWGPDYFGKGLAAAASFAIDRQAIPPPFGQSFLLRALSAFR